MRRCCNGAKHHTEAQDCRKTVVGERRIQRGSQSGSPGGAGTSANDGMSNREGGREPPPPEV